MRNLVLVLGDQLDPHSSAFDGFNRDLDAVWMAEAPAEAQYVWTHKARIALFLSAMRHFRDALLRRGIVVDYQALGDAEEQQTLDTALMATVRRLNPRRLIVVEPGEYRVLRLLGGVAAAASIPLEVRPDRHFLCSMDEFQRYAEGRKHLRMEYFYRERRRSSGFLMEGKTPVGGRWNYDGENRVSFGNRGPGAVPPPVQFSPDRVTREVLDLVGSRFRHHPGSLDAFDLAVTPEDACRALEDFIEQRLARFGPYQDAMWAGEPYLYHSRLSAAMNLKLLDPRDALLAACQALEAGHAPLASVEGFVRQILGWREYVRGIYWTQMPQYAEGNFFAADLPLPRFYWTGETEMRCLAEVLSQTLRLGYAHHIQRLMVTGLFALLLGVEPVEVHRWYLAIYVDAVEWVEMPNTLGMSQFADGGVMASKPYVATGKYIDRMSNYCSGCRYDPDEASGPKACPYTTLYWDFLDRHASLLKRVPRMSLQLRNLERITTQDLHAIRIRADEVRKDIAGA